MERGRRRGEERRRKIRLYAVLIKIKRDRKMEGEMERDGWNGNKGEIRNDRETESKRQRMRGERQRKEKLSKPRGDEIKRANK